MTGSGTSPWRYVNPSASPKSSVTILSRAFASNRTYQWMVYMENRRNPTLQTTGYLLIQVTDTQSQMAVSVG